jgi:hypothetical protein
LQRKKPFNELATKREPQRKKAFNRMLKMCHCEWYMAQGPFSRAEQTMVIASEAKQSACSVPGDCSWERFSAKQSLKIKRLLRQKAPRNDSCCVFQHLVKGMQGGCRVTQNELNILVG